MTDRVVDEVGSGDAPVAAEMEVPGAPVAAVAAPVAWDAAGGPSAAGAVRPSLADHLSAVGAGISAIWVRELRGRMRGPRAFIFLTFHLGVLGLLTWAASSTISAPSGNIVIDPLQAANIGKALFILLMAIQTVIVFGLAPSYTSGSISQEREKQTLDLLVVTPITTLSIIVGKLLSGLGWLLILLLASLPMVALAFVFGGVEPVEMLRSYIAIVAMAIGLGSLGVFFSAFLRRTGVATFATYITALILTVGLFLTWLFWPNDDFQDIDHRGPEVLLWLNPGLMQADVFCDVTGDIGICRSVSLNPAEPAFAPQDVEVIVAPDGRPVPVPIAQEPQRERNGFWVKGVLSWLAVAALATAGATQVVSPTRRWARLNELRTNRARRAGAG